MVTFKYAIKKYISYHGLTKATYAEKCEFAKGQFYEFMNHDKDIMIRNFHKVVSPLGYYLDNQGKEIQKKHHELGYRETLIRTGRQTDFVERCVHNCGNISLKKYIELMDGFEIPIVWRNRITEPLYRELFTTNMQLKKDLMTEQIENLEKQGIVDWNNEL